jgi:hypothetical protein
VRGHVQEGLVSTLFDGVDDVMTFPLSGAMNDALTILIVCRIMTASDNTWLSLVEFERSGGGNIEGAALGRRPGGSIGEIYFTNTTGIVSAGAIQDADGWEIIAVTRSAAAAGNVHRLPIGGSRTTTALGALADGLTCAGGLMRIGGDDDFANIRVAAVAYWDGTELTTGQLDGILSAKTTASINALSPSALYDDSDSFATDLTAGTQDRTSVVGTATDADNPSGWVYGVGGATVTFACSISGQAGVTAAKVLTRSLAATVAGQGAVAPAVVLTRSLAAVIAGQGTPVVALTVSSGGVVSFSVDIAGQGAVAPDMVRQISLAASVAGQGGVVGQIAFLRLLAAVVAGQGAVAPGSLNVFRGFAATIAGQGALTAALADIIGLQALVAGQGAVAVSTTETKRFVASIAGQAAIIVALTGGLRWLQEQIIANPDPLVPAVEGAVDLLTAAAIGSTDLLVAQVEDSH